MPYYVTILYVMTIDHRTFLTLTFKCAKAKRKTVKGQQHRNRSFFPNKGNYKYGLIAKVVASKTG